MDNFLNRYIGSSDQIMIHIGKVGIEADFYLETIEYPMKLMKYKSYGTDSSIAELATSEVDILGKKYMVEILAPGAGDYIPAGSTVSLRTIPLKKGDNC